MTAQAQEYVFQAETRQLLDLVIHSLYTNKEIFLRELISNASDALDRLRFEALTNSELLGGGERFEIRLEPDPAARTLTISDTGIGMSRDEVIAHIGTIAKSGTRELRERMGRDESSRMIAEMIGQFGVGFYSAFMVADRVTLVTRRAGEAAATLWESDGGGTYRLAETTRDHHGTSITLHLKPADRDAGLEDYTDQWTLSRVVKKYSDFVVYPIICRFESEEPPDPAKAGGSPPTFVIQDKTLNSMRPIWTRPQSEVSEGEYTDFYRHVARDWEPPFKAIPLKAEGVMEYQALLFIPSKAPYDLFYQATQSGLRLYAKRVVVVEHCAELLPRYLRFIKGVVDSADLPLNISRQMLQQDRHIAQIRKWLSKKTLDVLAELKEKDGDKYVQFWKEFGRAVKEGVSEDYDNRERIVSLLLFQSSNDTERLTTLRAYVERMKPEQTEIYYLTGETRAVIENSPHLEAFREKGYEVLYLVDPVDELLVQSLSDFEGKRLQSVGKGSIRLGSDEEKQQAESALKQKEEEAAGLLSYLQKSLDKDVKHVRLSSRLVSSPACLVGTEMDYSPQLERLLQKGKGGGPKSRRILELNPDHEVFRRLLSRFRQNSEAPGIAEQGELLLGYAFLAEGSELPDPVRFNELVIKTMLQTSA